MEIERGIRKERDNEGGREGRGTPSLCPGGGIVLTLTSQLLIRKAGALSLFLRERSCVYDVKNLSSRLNKAVRLSKLCSRPLAISVCLFDM